MTAEDVVFLSSPLTFDPSVVEMFLALSSGASLLIVPSAVKKMPRRLAHVLFKRNTTTVLQAREVLILICLAYVLFNVCCFTHSYFTGHSHSCEAVRKARPAGGGAQCKFIPEVVGFRRRALSISHSFKELEAERQ